MLPSWFINHQQQTIPSSLSPTHHEDRSPWQCSRRCWPQDQKSNGEIYHDCLTDGGKDWKGICFQKHMKRLLRGEDELSSSISCLALHEGLFSFSRYPWSPLDISPNIPPGCPSPLAQDLLLSSRNSQGSRAEARRIAFLCASLKGFRAKTRGIFNQGVYGRVAMYSYSIL